MSNHLNICLCSDFFEPSIGGIETHIKEIAKQFIVQGHHCCVITRSQAQHIGTKLLYGTLKVYYLPRQSMKIGASLPSFWFHIPQLTKILIDEHINVIHCHQSTSAIGFEVGVIGELLGIPVFVTEHSLFSLGVIGALHDTAVINPFLHCCNQIIAVSHVQKENLIARVGCSGHITVIPNGIDPNLFHPIKDTCKTHYPTIIAVTRFEWRRGGNLLQTIIQNVCKKDSTVNWIIVGGGSTLENAKKSTQQYSKRVKFLGPVVHEKIPDILRQGDFFVNCSLTDAFCVSIVEAAACGLYVISTDVGGIPEVLPPEAITLCPPCVQDLTESILIAIREKKNLHSSNLPKLIGNTLSWAQISSKILNIYQIYNQKKNPFKIIVTQLRPLSFFVSFIYYTITYIIILLFYFCKY